MVKLPLTLQIFFLKDALLILLAAAEIYFYFCKQEKLEVNIFLNRAVKYNAGVLIAEAISIFFDSAIYMKQVQVEKVDLFVKKQAPIDPF